MATQFEKATRLRPEYRFAKVDVDAEPGLASRFGIRSIPTLVVLRDGEPLAAQAGVIGAEQLVEALMDQCRRCASEGRGLMAVVELPPSGSRHADDYPHGANVGPIGRLGRYTATHFPVVLLGWLVVALGLGLFAPKVETALSGAGWETRLAVGAGPAADRQELSRPL